MSQWIASCWAAFKSSLFLADAEISLWQTLLIAAAFSFLFGIALIGIPGALFMTGMQTVLQALGKEVPRSTEATWGVVIVISLLIPVAIPVGHWLLQWGFPRKPWAMGALILSWSVVLGTVGALVPAK